jgi:hypothetical protein
MKMGKNEAGKKRKRVKRQSKSLTNDIPESDGGVIQNEVENETEIKVINNDTVNVDNTENKSEIEGAVPQNEVLSDPDTEVGDNEDINMVDVENESNTEPTVGDGVDVTTTDDKSQNEMEVDHDAEEVAARALTEHNIEVNGRCGIHEAVAGGVNIGATVTESEAGVNTSDDTALPVMGCNTS